MPERAWTKRVFALLVVALAVALRFAYLTGPSLRGDEALSVIYAQRSLPEIVHITRFVSGHPPLFYSLLHFWVGLAGTSEFAVRFFSVWWAVVLLPLAYAMGSKLCDHWAGFWAALLLAVNSFQVWHAQDIRSYSMLGTLALLSCWAFWRALHRPHWRNWAVYALAGVAVVHCHYFGAFVILGHGVYWLVVFWGEDRSRRRALWWGSVLSWAGIVASLLPWLWLARTVLAGDHGPGGRALSLWGAFRQSLVTFGVGYWREPWGWDLMTAGLIALLAWGVWSAARRAPRPAGFVTAVVVVPLACLLVLVRSRPIFRERYLVYSAPAYALLIGAGLAALGARWGVSRGRLFRAWAARLVLAVALLFLAGLNLFALKQHYLSPAYAKSPEWREALTFLRARLAQGDAVVLNHQDQAVLYYWGDDLVVLPAPGVRDRASVQATLRNLMDGHDRIWLLPDTSQLWDREGMVREWLDGNAEPVLERAWRGVLLLRYHTPRYLGQEYVPLDARLETESGAGIELLGYSLRDGEGRAVDRLEVAPGDEVRLTLYWQAESDIADEYVVFCHLLDETGWLRGQQDNPPRQGTYPTRMWTPGETVIDVYRVPLAPDAPLGSALIEIGMYDPADGQRLAVRGRETDPEQRRVLLRGVIQIHQ
jgi:4-amino-4-deoxy-L-arabinose transferase-like glycosyltransferase